MMVLLRGVWATMFLIQSSAALTASTVNKNDATKKSEGQSPPCTDGATSCKNHGQALIDWVRSRGGYVNDKFELRRMDPGDPTSPFGAFAAADIEADETLFHIPRSCYLSPSRKKVGSVEGDDDEEEDYDDDEEEDEEPTASSENVYRNEGQWSANWEELYAESVCELAHFLLDEWASYKLNPGTSKYAPYFSYLDTQPLGAIPATYSELGRAVLKSIVDRPIASFSETSWENFTQEDIDRMHYALHPAWHMTDWIDDHFVASGCIEADDEMGRHAVALAIQRGYDSEFIPIWDMVNHSNEKVNVEADSVSDEDGIEVWASVHIPAGNEIFATYNYCTDCFDVGDEWGTPGIFRDFGFVEGDYQVWPYLDFGIWFQMTYSQDETENGEKQLTYFDFDEDEESGEIFGLPDEKGLTFLHSELHRLSSIPIAAYQKLLPEHEFQNIQEYHHNLILSLKTVIAATNNYWDDEEEEDDDDDESDESAEDL